MFWLLGVKNRELKWTNRKSKKQKQSSEVLSADGVGAEVPIHNTVKGQFPSGVIWKLGEFQSGVALISLHLTAEPLAGTIPSLPNAILHQVRARLNMHRCGGLGADKEIDVFPFVSAGSHFDLHQNRVGAAFNLQSTITATDHRGIVEHMTVSGSLILNELFERCLGINGVLNIHGIFIALDTGIQKFKSSFALPT